jgi:hypothetical protein
MDLKTTRQSHGTGRKMGVKMNRNLIIISTLSSIIILAIIVGVGYSANSQPETITPIVATVSTDCSSCSIEKGLDKYVPIIKPAVESYLNQDSSEPASDRSRRLSLYFAGSSPVYEYEQQNISSSVKKSSAEILSIKSSLAETENIVFIVKVNIKSYSGKNTSTKAQDYWISLSRTFDQSLIAYDIGVMK